MDKKLIRNIFFIEPNNKKMWFVNIVQYIALLVLTGIIFISFTNYNTGYDKLSIDIIYSMFILFSLFLIVSFVVRGTMIIIKQRETIDKKATIIHILINLFALLLMVCFELILLIIWGMSAMAGM